MKKNIKKLLLLLAIGFGCILTGKAQTNNFGTGYFQNQYLFNPAMIGTNSSQLNINAAYKRESTTVSDGPKTMYLTADYASSNSVGLGINILTDKIGPLTTTKLMASYAYKLQLNGENQSIHFGLSAGGVQERFNAIDITGDPTDVVLYNFNDRKMQFEADFGAVYIRDQFTLQAAVPNLVSALRNKERTVLSQGTLFASASYKFGLPEDDIHLEPKVAYRSFKGLKTLIDAGVNADFKQNIFNLYGMYHSNKSITTGAGFKVLDAVQISASYTSSNANYSGGSFGNAFEIGLCFFTGAKKK